MSQVSLTSANKTVEIDSEVQAVLDLKDEDWGDGICCIEPGAGKNVLIALLSSQTEEFPNEEDLRYFFDEHLALCRFCQKVPVDRIVRKGELSEGVRRKISDKQLTEVS